MNKILHSLDGYRLPEVGQVGIFWPLASFTVIYDSENFNFENATTGRDYGGDIDEPELVLPV